jgi:hypothetical protein
MLQWVQVNAYGSFVVDGSTPVPVVQADLPDVAGAPTDAPKGVMANARAKPAARIIFRFILILNSSLIVISQDQLVLY